MINMIFNWPRIYWRLEEQVADRWYSYGKAYYGLSIKVFTTTEYDQLMIHELRLKVKYSNFSTEMEKSEKGSRFEGDLKEFFDHVKD